VFLFFWHRANIFLFPARIIGMYVANRASDKITQLTDNVYVCRSGSVSAHVIF